MKLSEATYFPDAKELTRHGFVSHMEDFIGKLLGNNPLGADVDDYLKGFDIDTPKALKMLTTPEIPDNPDTAIVIRSEKIKNGGVDEFGKPMKDEFQVIYKVPKRDRERGIKGIDEKLRNLYIKMFENHTIEGTVLTEDGEGGMCGDGGTMEDMGGATNASSSGQFVQPLFGIVRRKGYSPKTTKNEAKKMKHPIGKAMMFITEEQMRQLSEILKEEAVLDTRFGDFGYDAPGLKFSKDDETMDHTDLLTRKKNKAVGHKSLEEGDSGIHIKKSHEGKLTDLKKRTGKTESEIYNDGNPDHKKMVVFARNARKWNHD